MTIGKTVGLLFLAPAKHRLWRLDLEEIGAKKWMGFWRYGSLENLKRRLEFAYSRAQIVDTVVKLLSVG